MSFHSDVRRSSEISFCGTGAPGCAPPTQTAGNQIPASRLTILLAIALILAAPNARAQDEANPKQMDISEITEDLHGTRETALVRAAKVAGPGIVSIGAERTAYVRRGPFGNENMFPFFFEPFPSYEKYREKTPYLGSGIVADDEGHVVTNYHVIRGAERIFVTLACGTEREAELIDYDAIGDLAVLRIDPESTTPAPLGDSDDVRPGEWVLAIGNPYGIALGDPCPTITAGVVSARNRFFRTTGESPHLYEGMIQTDAAINPGNSGGALVNALGEVIGVNTFIFSQSGGSVGIGFAIPVNKAKRMLEEIRQYGMLRPTRIDFEVINVTAYLQRELDLASPQGVLVYRVESGGPADVAGIEPGDVILRINRHDVVNRREFLIHFAGASAGERLELELMRNKKTERVRYVVQARSQ